MTQIRGTAHVIVAGAGPVGMTAALLLARGGVRVTVLEAGESLAGESRASTFHPPSLEMLDELGQRVVSAETDGVTATVTTEVGDTFTADWVLGADGANSQVRQTAGFTFEGMTYPERFLVASTTEDLETILPGISAVNYVFDPTEWLVLLRTPEHWRI